MDEFVTNNDEAFALLLLKNYWDNVTDGKGTSAKWTRNGRNAKTTKGWKKQGMAYYKAMTLHVHRDRVARGERFHRVLLEYLSGKKDKRRSAAVDDDDEDIIDEFNLEKEVSRIGDMVSDLNEDQQTDNDESPESAHQPTEMADDSDTDTNKILASVTERRKI
eukprot:Pompholyxophrys_punicea_v1_NODE_28_length_5163_cov_5.731206.p4 type:complete len:163 gc:universal NODE_28_length_5163_cov_5.731206:4080-3592(-)